MSNVFDDFNRADSPLTLGTATSGQTWANVDTAVWGILTGAADCQVDPNQGFAVIDSNFRNTTVQATVLDVTAGGNLNSLNWGLTFCFQDINNWYLVAYDAFNPHFLRLCSKIAGVFRGNYAPAHSYVPVNGDVIKVVNCGTSVEVFVNGASLYAASDPDLGLLTGTKQGLQCGEGVVTPPQHARWDDFSAELNLSCEGAVWTIPPIVWSASGTVVNPVPPAAGTFRFDEGEGSSYYLVAPIIDSGNELRSKNVKAMRATGKFTDASMKCYGYDINDEINVQDLEDGTNASTRAQSIPDSTNVAQSPRKQINVKNAVLSTIRIEGDDTGETERDTIHEITYEQDDQGVRR